MQITHVIVKTQKAQYSVVIGYEDAVEMGEQIAAAVPVGERVIGVETIDAHMTAPFCIQLSELPVKKQ